MARTTHGHHIPGTELDEEIYYPASICGGPHGCGQCIEEVRKTPKKGGSIVSLSGHTVNDDYGVVGWTEVGEDGKTIIGEMVITNSEFLNQFMDHRSLASVEIWEGQ